MSTPALGCQIAPHYDTDHDSSDTNSTFTGEVEEEEDRDGEAAEATPVDSHLNDVEKAKTQPGHAASQPSRPTTLSKGRTKSARSEAPPTPVGFWSAKLAGVRVHVLLLWAKTNLILALGILAFLCLFWGALFKQVPNLHHLPVYVVDFDAQISPYQDVEPFVGPFVTRSIQSIIDAGAPHLGYTFLSPGDFDDDPLKVRDSVFDFKAWAAVIINPNATAILQEAALSGNSSYDPLGACQIVYNSARDSVTSSSYIIPAMIAIQKHAVSVFGREWIARLLQNNTASDLHLDVCPQAISPGIEFTMYDLRPFGPAIATPAVSIGLIYLIIISFFSFTFFLPIHLKYLSPKGHPPLHFHQLIIWRYVATVASYCLLSCVYSLVSLAYLMPMNNRPASHEWPSNNPNSYYHGTFVVYWMINFVGMTAFGLASENMAMILGTPWTALWLIFWVISNVATGFYPVMLASSFYRWGYAWPMHNIVEATRQILFDLHPRIGLNIGVLFVWVAVDTLLFPFCCYYMRWKTIRAKKLAAAKEAAWKERMEKSRQEPNFLEKVTTLRGQEGGRVSRLASRLTHRTDRAARQE